MQSSRSSNSFRRSIVRSYRSVSPPNKSRSNRNLSLIPIACFRSVIRSLRTISGSHVLRRGDRVGQRMHVTAQHLAQHRLRLGGKRVFRGIGFSRSRFGDARLLRSGNGSIGIRRIIRLLRNLCGNRVGFRCFGLWLRYLRRYGLLRFIHFSRSVSGCGAAASSCSFPAVACCCGAAACPGFCPVPTGIFEAAASCGPSVS